MQIKSGIFDHGVWQRNAENVSDQKITGISHYINTAITWTVNGEHHPGGNTTADGSFSIRIYGLPMGGPYTITITAENDSITFEDLLVGDIWILAGQSNMQGAGALADEPPAVDMVRAFRMDDRWSVAHGRLHNLKEAKTGIHWKLRGDMPFALRYDATGIGPGQFFGQYLYRKTGIPQGLIVSAHGGTSIEQWDPALKNEGPDNSLYAALLERIERNGGRVAGMFWYQGENNINPGQNSDFSTKTKSLINALRRDLDTPMLPVVMAQLGYCAMAQEAPVQAGWNMIREAQRQMQNHHEQIAVVPTLDLELEDCIHLDARSQMTLGRRAGEAMLTLLNWPNALPMPIELDSIEPYYNRPLDHYELIVRYKNVAGNLQSGGVRAAGFYMTRTGQIENVICKIHLEGDHVIIRFVEWHREFNNTALGYGCGGPAYTNITDSAGRSLPGIAAVSIPAVKIPDQN